MGFEYKIIAKFTEKEISEIKYVLETSKDFDKKYEFNTKVFWDFRQLDNKGKMPNISVCFEKDGIYVCRYDTIEVWENLQELKEYIEHKNIRYTIFDYQE